MIKRKRSPRFLSFLLKQFVNDFDEESLLGDFEETYHYKAKETSESKAKAWYLWHIAKLIPVYIQDSIRWSINMLKNYFKIALRIIKRHKGYSFINILGLALGMAVCILILFFVRYELSFDRHHNHADRIYRIERIWTTPDGSVRGGFCSVAPSFIPFMEEEFPEIEHIARTVNGGNVRVSLEDKHFIENRLFFAEGDIFEIFTLPLIEGDPATALKEPATMVISESMARKYFGTDNPMGKQMKLRDDQLVQVTGVMLDMPPTMHVHYDFLVSYISLKGQPYRGDDYFLGNTNFTDNVTYSYMRLAEGVDIEDFQAKIPAFIDKTLGTRKDSDGNTVLASQGTNLLLSKVTDIHLHSRYPNELEPNFDIRYVKLFTIIAVFVLIIACINFMNLSTARATQRAKEVGLRKVVGANRRILTAQFLGESVFFSFLAMVLALGLVVLVLPFFNNFSGRALSFNFLLNPMGIVILLGVLLTTGLVAGLYPAFYISAFKSASILRGELTRGIKGTRLRTILVVFQFAISICLIICVGIVYRQMNYLMTADLGFQRDHIVMLPSDSVIRNKWEDIRQNLISSPHIEEATLSKRAPTGMLADAPGFWVEINGERQNSPFGMPHNRVTHDFFNTYNIKIIAGRDFSREYASDLSEAFILNETAVRRLGFASPEEAVGTLIGTFAPNKKGQVIGVAADFNYESLHREIRPVITYLQPNQVNTVALRVARGRIPEAIDHLKSVWARFHPESPVKYDFLDDRIVALYRNEAKMMQMFGYFSVFAVIISCLGLFGLASFTAERRTKEIGVRKVMGASLGNITFLLSKDFSKWVLLANIIAWPIAYFAMSKWLNNFAYHIYPGWVEFVLAALLTLLIALFTVSYQSLRAATADPINSLRYE